MDRTTIDKSCPLFDASWKGHHGLDAVDMLGVCLSNGLNQRSLTFRIYHPRKG